MILYADTSNLFKLYVLEEGSADVQAVAAVSSHIASSIVAYTETRVAFARAVREGRLDQDAFEDVRRKFDAEWPRIGGIDVGTHILRESGNLGDRYPVRAFDAIHLASAKEVRASATEEVMFSSADRRLRDAAIAEGFALAP